MKRLGSLLLCVTAVGAPLYGLGSTVTITFDEYNNGAPVLAQNYGTTPFHIPV